MITSRGANGRSSLRSWLFRPALLALALAAVAPVALLASGSGSSSSEGVAQVGSGETTTGAGSQGSSGAADMAAFNACMRRRGVALSAKGTPRFEAAKTACARFLPRDDDTPDQRDQARQLQLVLRHAACMRRNGLPRFPDPKPNPDGYVKITPEALSALGLNPSSPKYKAAEKACKNAEP